MRVRPLAGADCAALWRSSLPPSPADADVTAYLGRPLADVRVEVAGAPFNDATVLQLIETRVGEPLSMERVRETVDHLIGLARFEDIKVFADPAPTPAGRRRRFAGCWSRFNVSGRFELSGSLEFERRDDSIRDHRSGRRVAAQIASSTPSCRPSPASMPTAAIASRRFSPASLPDARRS